MDNSLYKMRPHLVSEWSDKNLPLTPDDISYGSNKVVWWRGKCGHEWQTSVKARSHGENCPICSGSRVIEGINDLATKYPEIAAEWSTKNLPLKPTMVSAGSHKKVIWVDKLGHEWTASVKSRVQGSGCPYCSHNLVLAGFNDLASRFPEIASEWSERNLPLTPDKVTAFKNTRVWWKCHLGHEWYTLISTRSGGSQCPYCSGIKLLIGFNDLATKYPTLAKEWSERNLPLTPDMVNEKSTKNVWWKCRTCGYEWKSVVRARAKGSLCPVCADRTVLAGYNDLATTDPELLDEWDYEKNTGTLPTAVSRNSMKIVWWKCSSSHSWRAKITDRTIEQKGCYLCEREFQSAFPQLLIMLYAVRNGLKVTTNNDKLIGINLDTYIPELRLAIEAEATTITEQRSQMVKEHICECNGIRYVKLKHSNDLIKTAQSIKEAFRKCHTFFQTNDEEDIEILRTRFQNWRKQK
ncbi:TPA: zinc-ribbon domain-containing protein [Enterococcus faecium]